MTTFIPVYRRSASTTPLWTQPPKNDRKRKLDHASEDIDEDSDGNDAVSEQHVGSATTGADLRVPFPINSRDPYYIAGHSRERPLPGGNYPHAAVREVKKATPLWKDRLSALGIQATDDSKSGSSARRRHLDNLTAVMHKCMLDDDWPRASRAWALILRIEVDGGGIDIRQHGRWQIGAELLMHRANEHQELDDNDASELSARDNGRSSTSTTLSSAGLALARQYYERLVLQYPHLQRTHQKSVSSLVIYPALFNVWIYGVQDRAKRARAELRGHSSDDASDVVDEDVELQVQNTYKDETEGAIAIAQRLDELLQSPPYDTTPSLLELRGGVALWLSDLHQRTATLCRDSSGSTDDPVQHRNVDGKQDYESMGRAGEEEKHKAREIFSKMLSENMAIQPEYAALARRQSIVIE